MADVVSAAPAPGMPDVALAAVIALPALLTSDAPGVLSALGSAPWGVYLNGAPVIVADTVLDLGYTKTYSISDYPIEQGSFASYDKVEQPFEARVRFASGGSPDVRAALIASVEGIVGDLNLYDVVTPDGTYVNANVTREEYRRVNTDGGASLLTIDVALQEVRELAGDATGQSTADPASAAQTNGGTVQPQTQGGVGSDSVASAQAALNVNPVTTPLPETLGGGTGGIGSA